MNSRSPGPKLKVGSKCNLILQKCLALQLQKVGLYANGDVSNKFNHTSSDHLDTNTLQDVPKNTQPFWMYDSGYLVFQVSNMPSMTKLVLMLTLYYVSCAKLG